MDNSLLSAWHRRITVNLPDSEQLARKLRYIGSEESVKDRNFLSAVLLRATVGGAGSGRALSVSAYRRLHDPTGGFWILTDPGAALLLTPDLQNLVTHGPRGNLDFHDIPDRRTH